VSRWRHVLKVRTDKLGQRDLLGHLLIRLVTLDYHRVALEHDAHIPQMVLIDLVEILGVDPLEQIAFDKTQCAVDCD
jgi:hypothetical protein